MAHHDEETTLLEAEIGIYIDYGVIAYFGAKGVVFLYAVASCLRTVFWGVVFGEPAHIGSEMYAEDAGDGEIEIEVGPVVEGWHCEEYLLAALLIGETILPVEDAETEILLYGEGKQTDVGGRLFHVCRIARYGGLVVSRCTIVVYAEVGIVLYVIVAGTNGGAGFLDEELRLEVRLHLLVEAGVIPREELSMIVGFEEAWLAEMVESLEANNGGVTEYAHIEVSRAIYAYITHVFTHQSELGCSIIMKTFAKGLDKLTAYVNVILIGGGVCFVRVWQGVVS